MKHVKKTATFKKAGSFVLGFFAMVLLFSCRKSPADLPGQSNPEATALNQSTAAQVQSSVDSVPFETTLFIACANGGAGEEVQLTGVVINDLKIIRNDHGFTLTYHTNPRGISGVGLSTGYKYTVSGGTEGTINGAFENSQFTGGYIERLNVIGPGTNFMVSYHFHVTVRSDGTFTSSISDEKTMCK